MAIPIIAGAAAGKATETASMQTASMGVQVAASGASSGGVTSTNISGTQLGGSQSKVLLAGSNTGGAGINGSPLGGLQSRAKKGLTGNTDNTGNTSSTQKSPSLYEKVKEKMKDHGPRIKSAINKTNRANEMRKDVHGFGKDMMGQDAHRNDPEHGAPSVHNRYRRL